MRFPKPFFRSAKACWYLQIGNRQISLGPERDEAFRRYREILLHETGEPPDAGSKRTVAEVFDLFLDWAASNTQSYEWYEVSRHRNRAGDPADRATRPRMKAGAVRAESFRFLAIVSIQRGVKK